MSESGTKGGKALSLGRGSTITRRTVPHARAGNGDADGDAAESEVVRLRRENEQLRDKLQQHAPVRRSAPSSSPRPKQLAPNTLIAERFELERLLARGGMGAVWVALDRQSDVRVAVKFLPDEPNHEQISRFNREMEVCQAVHSKHVVTVLDHGVDGTFHYLAMELLDGESLADLLERTGKLNLTEASALARDIRIALEPVHAAGVVHRDLKPQNLFSSRDPQGAHILKLLDFGLAKALPGSEDRPGADDGETTRTGAIIGSPSYMSPEQAHGSVSIDHRCDLWAVAVILYRVLTGQRPWDGESAIELLLHICTEPAPPPSQHNPGLPPAIDAFFARAFARDVDDRFATIGELSAAFHVAAGATSPWAPNHIRPSEDPPSLEAKARSMRMSTVVVVCIITGLISGLIGAVITLLLTQ